MPYESYGMTYLIILILLHLSLPWLMVRDPCVKMTSSADDSKVKEQIWAHLYLLTRLYLYSSSYFRCKILCHWNS